MNWLNKTQLKELKNHPEELKEYVDKAFDYYRTNGFPYLDFNYQERYAMFRKLLNVKTERLWKGDTIGRHNCCYTLANYYNPHLYSVISNTKTGTFKSPIQTFNDDKSLRKLIEKTIHFDWGLNDEAIRAILRFGNGTKRVSNFRPTAAKAIYDRFCPPNAKIYDPSMGYGGRLLGAFASSKVKTYIGTEPAELSFKSAHRIAEDFAKDVDTETLFFMDGSENILNHYNIKDVDLCFTSPPYFNCEVYSHEDTQSWKKYPTKNEWMEGFMKDTLTGCKTITKQNGYIIINIAKVPTYPEIEQDIVETAKSIGLNHIDTLKLELSNAGVLGANRKSDTVNIKFEPMFVFQQEGADNWVYKKEEDRKLF